MNLPWEIELSLDTKGKQKGTKYSKSPNHVWTTNQTLIYDLLTWKYYIGMYFKETVGMYFIQKDLAVCWSMIWYFMKYWKRNKEKLDLFQMADNILLF